MADETLPQTAGEDQEEEWRDIPGIEGYQASSLGRIRSIDHEVTFFRRGRWTTHRRKGMIRKLTPCPNPVGIIYYRVYLGKQGFHLVNRLVCMTFNGPPPTLKHHAAHLNGKSLENWSGNLAWATASENGIHRFLHGTSGRGIPNVNALGSGSVRSKLTEAMIPDIFLAYINGQRTRTIAANFGVSSVLIQSVLSRRTWHHVEIDQWAIDKVRERLAHNGAVP
jgi:hypothetical protein